MLHGVSKQFSTRYKQNCSINAVVRLWDGQLGSRYSSDSEACVDSFPFCIGGSSFREGPGRGMKLSLPSGAEVIR
jgi:hypothetical protein